jgi:hypothetical protein
MVYLMGLATKFQRLVSLSMNATHGADDAFETSPDLCIAPAVMSRMKIFSDEMAKYGESYSFNCNDGGIPHVFGDDPDESLPDETFDVRKEDDPEELVDILLPQESLCYPLHGETKDWLFQVFKDNQGFELGTFNASILATVMKKQSSKWEDISMGFVSDAIVLVHRFITSALVSICDDDNVCDALAGKLSDELTGRYQKAITSAGFLLKVEKSNTPMIMNHYFNDNLQRR